MPVKQEKKKSSTPSSSNKKYSTTKLSKNETDLLTTKKVAKTLTVPPKPTRAKPSAADSDLPLCSELSDSDDTRRASVLLSIAHKQTAARKEADEQIRECKDELAALCLGHDLPGLRAGLYGIRIGGYKRRKSFNADKAKRLMLDAGVDPSAIGECYEEGEEYLDTRLVELS